MNSIVQNRITRAARLDDDDDDVSTWNDASFRIASFFSFSSPLLPFSSSFLKPSPRGEEFSQPGTWLISSPINISSSGFEFEFFLFFSFFFQRSVIRVKMIRRCLIWIFRWFEDFFFEQFNSFDYCGLLQVNQKFFKRSFLILRRDIFIERIELNVCHLVYVIVLQVVQKLSVLLIVISNNGFFLLLLPYIGRILCFFFLASIFLDFIRCFVWNIEILNIIDKTRVNVNLIIKIFLYKFCKKRYILFIFFSG